MAGTKKRQAVRSISERSIQKQTTQAKAATTPLTSGRTPLFTQSHLCVEHLLATQDRWSEDNRPLVVEQALIKLLLYSAHFQTHDPALLHIKTGFPLRFVMMAMSVLMGNALWLGPEGYSMLVWSLANYPVNLQEIDGDLAELMMGIFTTEEGLVAEWHRAMGVTYAL